MSALIGMIVTGAIVGALARLFMRGRQNISLIWTIICGAIGAGVGGWVASYFGVAHTAGVDWIRWILSVIAAMLTISLYMNMSGKR